MSSALLFPGQGSQTCGMLSNLPRSAATDRTLAEAAHVLHHELGPHSADPLDSAQRMQEDSAAIQLALAIAGTSCARTLSELGATPNYVAGHSAGAYAAAVAAGVLEFADALELVRLRGALMTELFPPQRGYGMAALTGLPEARIGELAQRVQREGHDVFPANVNAPDQVTVSGSEAGLARITELARAMGVHKAVRLAVPVPAHCPLVQPVADHLASRLRDLAAAGRLRPPNRPYVGNIDARVLETADRIAHDLAHGTARPVRWHDATTALYERGVRLFVETSPGVVLTHLAAAAFPQARALAIDQSGIDSARLLLHRASAT